MNTNNPSKLKLSYRQKFVDGWTDRRAEEQTDRKMDRATISIGCTLPKQGPLAQCHRKKHELRLVFAFFHCDGDVHLRRKYFSCTITSQDHLAIARSSVTPNFKGKGLILRSYGRLQYIMVKTH